MSTSSWDFVSYGSDIVTIVVCARCGAVDKDEKVEIELGRKVVWTDEGGASLIYTLCSTCAVPSDVEKIIRGKRFARDINEI